MRLLFGGTYNIHISLTGIANLSIVSPSSWAKPLSFILRLLWAMRMPFPPDLDLPHRR